MGSTIYDTMVALILGSLPNIFSLLQNHTYLIFQTNLQITFSGAWATVSPGERERSGGFEASTKCPVYKAKETLQGLTPPREAGKKGRRGNEREAPTFPPQKRDASRGKLRVLVMRKGTLVELLQRHIWIWFAFCGVGVRIPHCQLCSGITSAVLLNPLWATYLNLS